MSDSKDEKPNNVHKLWHEKLEGSSINEMATELIRQFLSMGVKVSRINVFWDGDGNFITDTRGAHFRRVADKKTRDPSRD